MDGTKLESGAKLFDRLGICWDLGPERLLRSFELLAFWEAFLKVSEHLLEVWTLVRVVRPFDLALRYTDVKSSSVLPLVQLSRGGERGSSNEQRERELTQEQVGASLRAWDSAEITSMYTAGQHSCQPSSLGLELKSSQPRRITTSSPPSSFVFGLHDSTIEGSSFVAGETGRGAIVRRKAALSMLELARVTRFVGPVARDVMGLAGSDATVAVVKVVLKMPGCSELAAPPRMVYASWRVRLKGSRRSVYPRN
jgi:hypothetical protein